MPQLCDSKDARMLFPAHGLCQHVPTEPRAPRARGNGHVSLSHPKVAHPILLSKKKLHRTAPGLPVWKEEHHGRSVYESSRALEVAGFK